MKNKNLGQRARVISTPVHPSVKTKKTCQICRNYIRGDAVILTVCRKCGVLLVPYKSKKIKSLTKKEKT